MKKKKLIEYKGVDIIRGSFIVMQDVDLEVSSGETVYIVGNAGSGKTSLMQTVYAEVPIASGSAHVLDFDLTQMRRSRVPYLRRHIGIVFQDFRLLPDRSVSDNLDFVLRATQSGNAEQRKTRIAEVLEEVGLPGKSYKMPHELSGGEQQRVVIARALLNAPDLILADEPTGNLDPESSRMIFELLQRMAAQGKGVVIATHNHALVDRYPGRVVLCENKHLCHLP